MMVIGLKSCMRDPIVRSRYNYFVEFGHREAEADYTGIYPGSELKKMY